MPLFHIRLESIVIVKASKLACKQLLYTNRQKFHQMGVHPTGVGVLLDTKDTTLICHSGIHIRKLKEPCQQVQQLQLQYINYKPWAISPQKAKQQPLANLNILIQILHNPKIN